MGRCVIVGGSDIGNYDLIREELRKVATHVVPITESARIFDIITDPSEKAMKVLIKCSEEE